MLIRTYCSPTTVVAHIVYSLSRRHLVLELMKLKGVISVLERDRERMKSQVRGECVQRVG